MSSRILAAAVMALGLAAPAASAQQPAPPAPAFASPNLSPSGVRATAASCATCHGTDGHSVRGSPLNALAGKPRDEIVQTMRQFRSGEKPATLMHQIAKGFSEAEIDALADFFSKQPR